MEQKEFRIRIPNGYEIDKERSTFEEIIFKKKEEIETWNDLIDTPISKDSVFIGLTSNIQKINNSNLFCEGDKNVFIDKKHAKSALAMAQISQLMPYYGGAITNEEWLANYDKYIIRNGRNEIDVLPKVSYERHFLAFHTPEQRDEFLKYNKQLIKDYLMINE